MAKGELEHFFNKTELMEYADECQLASSRTRQEFSVSDIEACNYLKHVLSERLLPYSRYYYGEKSGPVHGGMVGLTCDSSQVERDLNNLHYGTQKFVCLQDSAAPDCDTEASEKVLASFLHSLFPNKSRFEI